MTSATAAATARVLRIQKFNRFLGAVLVPATVWFSLGMFMTVGGALWWTIFIAITLVGLHLFNWASFAATIFVVALTSDPMDFANDPDALVPVQMALTIENHPETPVGRYKDMEFFEWLDLADEDGIVRRANFSGTIDVQASFALPPGTILLAPGLLYEWAQVKAPVNISTQQ